MLGNIYLLILQKDLWVLWLLFYWSFISQKNVGGTKKQLKSPSKSKLTILILMKYCSIVLIINDLRIF